nr:reverse transcriptase domain-containing protein [Tanacetum cinerariifolium]
LFPPSKTTNLRNDITRFQQRFDESFYEAWERFNDLLRACPHHGFFEIHQLDTFYNALNINDQDSLNSAAGGNFLDKMPRACLKIIEIKSKVRQSRAKAVVSKVGTSSSTSVISSNVAELKDMVKALLLDKKNQSPAPTPSTTHAPIKAVESNCVNQASVYQAPIPQTQRVSQTDFESYVKANDAILRNMQSQGQSTQNQCQNIQNQYQNLQNQMATLTEMMSKLVSANTASSFGSGTLPVAPISAPIPNLKPSIPYPSRRDNEKRRDQANEQIEKFYEIFKDMSFEISFTDALILMPKFVYTLKALIGNKEKLKFTPTCMTLELADRSVSKPIGIAKDVSFKVGVFYFPADFVVVDFEPDPRVHLILRWCFLKTSRALIDVHKGELTLCIGNEAITYNLDQTVRYSTNYNQMTANKINVVESACEEYSQEAYEAQTVKSSVDEPPEIELKDLPHHLEYAFLEGDNKFPVIIAKEMRSEEKAALIKSPAPTPSTTHAPVKAVEPNCPRSKYAEPVPKHSKSVPKSANSNGHFDGYDVQIFSEPVVASVSALMPNLKPFIPYPSRRGNEKRHDQANEQIEKFYEIFKEMSFEISFTDALILMLKFASTLKALIGNKEKLSEMARTMINEHYLTVILNKLPRKLGDPEKFLIPCEFSGMDECLALADLDASINLMPLSVWEGLSLPELTPTCMTLKHADRSVSKPIAITYNLDQTVRYSTNYNQMTANKINVIESACEEYSQEVLGFSNVTTSGTPIPQNDPIVSATSPTLTSFEDSDFLLFEEVDAFLGQEDDPDSLKVNSFYYDSEGDILLLEAILNSKPSPSLHDQEQNMPSFKEELKAYEAQTVKSSVDEPPEVELKDLPHHLEYAFLEGDNKLSVIISKELGRYQPGILYPQNSNGRGLQTGGATSKTG